MSEHEAMMALAEAAPRGLTVDTLMDRGRCITGDGTTVTVTLIHGIPEWMYVTWHVADVPVHTWSEPLHDGTLGEMRMALDCAVQDAPVEWLADVPDEDDLAREMVYAWLLRELAVRCSYIMV